MKESPGKVLIIVENLPLPFDRRVWMESNTLKKNGYEVAIICPKGKGYEDDYEELNGIHIYRHNLPPEVSSAKGYLREYSHALWHEFRLARLIRKNHGFDVIHACNPPDLIFIVASWFKLFHGTKFIFDQHDLNPELYESKFNKKGFFHSALKVAEKLTFKLADTVISTNESYKEIAEIRGKKNPDDVIVVRSGPDLRFFNKVEENNSYRNNKKYLVGYLGVMGEFDGVDHLVKAAHYLIKEKGRTDIQFCFVGGGPMLESLKELSENLEIEGNVEFTGRVSDEELIERLSSCDVCANPDPLNPLNDKSTMNKILEYMALERPIVQYDLLEGKRSAGEASLYAEPNDIEDLANKIEVLLEDEELREKMGAIGRKRMEEEFEWKYQEKKLLKAYRHCLNK
ncbi:glycosyltransferase family 4 protein [Rhodohalobacter sp. 8-1]|uniref:glycosyltransferase family 4 protein n=1 Tax=Rhodohalobacter sp. 8-1 TaxID=3131972 RepID=UPI0030ED9C97